MACLELRLLRSAPRGPQLLLAPQLSSPPPLPHTRPAPRYRKPRGSYKNHRSETGARHSAFSRGSAYLERYCLLIAVAGYLEECGLHSATTFRQWLANRCVCGCGCVCVCVCVCVCACVCVWCVLGGGGLLRGHLPAYRRGGVPG